MEPRYIAGSSLAVLTVLLSIGCAAEESGPPSATPTATAVPATATAAMLATATLTATAVPATATPTASPAAVLTPTPTASPVATPTPTPRQTPLPTNTATPLPTMVPQASTVPTAIPTVAPTFLGVGEQIPLGELTVFISGWDTFSGNELAVPRQENTFVTVDLVVVNSGETLLSVSESLRLSLTDTTGASFVPDPIAGVAAGMGTIDGAVNPGERLRGIAVFEVPADSSGLRLRLASGPGTAKLVDLGPEPVGGPVLARLAGERTQNVVRIGQDAATGEIVLAVDGWSELPGGLLFKPMGGQKGIAVELVISNQGPSAISIASLVQTAVKDGDSRRYGSDLLATLASGSALDGELPSGQTIRGKVGFTVPIDVDGLVFTLDAGAFGGGKVFVELGSDPVSVTPAAQ